MNEICFLYFKKNFSKVKYRPVRGISYNFQLRIFAFVIICRLCILMLNLNLQRKWYFWFRFDLSDISTRQKTLFFKINFCWTHGHFGATDTPVLDFWWCLLWVSKPEWAALFTQFGRGVHDIHYLRFTSCATLLPVYMASIAASRFPHMHVSAEVGCWIWTADLLLGSQMR